MFAYLSKKLEMPSNSNIRCLAWSGGNSEGYLAAGCDNGLLKVLRIETQKGATIPPTNSFSIDSDSVNAIQPQQQQQYKGLLSAPTTISMNQTLEGHSSHIQVIAWNNEHQKLTSSDAKGLIIVWMLYKDTWYEEMVNNRNRSTVRGLSWSSDGSKICIVYEDGGVIVGSSDGNRLWGKELKGSPLTGVEWSPDAKYLLFTFGNGDIQIYDSSGSYMSKIIGKLQGVQLSQLEQDESSEPIVVVRWYPGKTQDSEIPKLAIIWKQNSMQLLRSIIDEKPIKIQTNLDATCGDWSPNGNYIAIGGTCINLGYTKTSDLDLVIIFDSFGIQLQTVRVPTGNPSRALISALAWDSFSLRIAIGCGSHIYFVNIRPNYPFAFFGSKVLAYTYTRNDGVNGVNQLAIWDQKRLSLQDLNGRVLAMKGNDDYCAILTFSNKGKYTATILNTIGAPIDSITIGNIEPFTMALSDFGLICLAKNAVFLYQFKSTSSHRIMSDDISKNQAAKRKEYMFHIDDTSTSNTDDFNKELLDYHKKPTRDSATCVDTSGELFFIGRESGRVQIHSAKDGSLISTFNLPIENTLANLWVNMDATMIAVTDLFGHLKVVNFDSSGVKLFHRRYERKDVWNLIFAKDNPSLFCIMEKTRMYVMKNGEQEEPVLTSGYLVHFKDLQVTSILLDELLLDPERPKDELIIKLETKTLKDTMFLIENDTSLENIMQYVEENSHPRLWRLLAQAALNQLNLTVAEAAFVKCKDYGGIKFTKRILNIENEYVRKAEVASFFGDFEKAEKLYIEGDRKDLCGEMWLTIQDYKRSQTSSMPLKKQRPSDRVYREMNLAMGNSFAEMQEWKRALQFYTKAEDPYKLVECYLMLEDYHNLEKLALNLPPNHPLLSHIARSFSAVGLSSQAIKTYLACDDVQMAIDTAKSLSQWDIAMDLARKISDDTVIPILQEYTRHLIVQNEYMKAVELLKKSDKYFAAAKLLGMLALKELNKKSEELKPLQVKKLFVLCAILFSHKSTNPKKSTRVHNDAAALLLPGGSEDFYFEECFPAEYRSESTYKWMREYPWKGAEAIHFYMLSCTYIHTGQFKQALRSSLVLLNYQDVLGEERVHAILAISAVLSKNFGCASRALIYLENFDEEYLKISSSIFSEQTPKDSRPSKVNCFKCNTSIPDNVSTCPSCNCKFSLCIKTGFYLTDTRHLWTCQNCLHSADIREISNRSVCPLCHTSREYYA